MKKIINSLQTKDLVIIGLFAGAAKTSSIMVALMGGGMNPLSLILKNALFSAMWLILLVKINKTGVLTLANFISSMIGFLLLAQNMLNVPALFFACLISELLFYYLKKRNVIIAAVISIAVCEFFSRAVSLIVSFITVREEPILLIPVAIITFIGYLGVIIGLFGGRKMIGELRHAGLIQN